MSDGTQQNQRSLAALESRRFPVDGLQLEQLVALCKGVARHLHFVDLNNCETQTWEALFDSDESLVLADIASFDHQAWRQDFNKTCDTQALTSVLGATLKLAQDLDGWHRALEGSPTPAVVAVREAISQVVRRQIAEPLRAMAQHFIDKPGIGPASREGIERQYLSLQRAVWPPLQPRRQPGPPDAAAPEAESERPSAASGRPLRATRQGLRALGFSLQHGVMRVQELARERLADTLDTGTHEPAAGLLLAFLRLYGRVQEQVNGFSARHIDFYFREVLGLAPCPAQADSLHLVCLPDARRDGPTRVPAGTRFNAGKDAQGQPLQFESLQTLQLGDARVVALATLLLQRDDKVTPEEAMSYVTGVRARRPWQPDPEAEAEAVPLFGGGPGSEEGRLGLALASPLLQLHEGERSIDLELSLAWPLPATEMLAQLVGAVEKTVKDETLQQRPSEQALQFRIALGKVFAFWLLGPGVELNAAQRKTLVDGAAAVQVSLGDAPDSSARRGLDPPALLIMCLSEPQDRKRVFFRHINDLFDIGLTGATGWLAVERIQFSLPPQGSTGGLHLRITLRPEDPAIIGCDPKIHGAEWPTRLPVLSLQVSPRAGIHPYSLFESAQFVRAELAVAVRGLRQLLLQNQLGPLDASKPFAPFGPLPSTASYLVLGAPEASVKTLDAMRLNLRWAGLPDDPGGWAEHYAAYPSEQSRGGFTAALSLLRGGTWHACSGRSAEQPLFDLPEGVQGRIPATQSFEVDSRSVREYAGPTSAPLESTYGARDGLLRLQLNGPRGAFGHAVYAELLGQAVRSRSWRKGASTLPRPPYTPELETISLDYEAHTVLKPRRDAGATGHSATSDAADRERLLHLHPFGIIDLQADAQRRHHTLLPALGPDGSLYIGLQAQSLQGPLTLYFQLRPPGAADRPGDEEPEPLQWDYLAADQWKPLRLREVPEDTTYGMLTSGIVTLDLPEDLSCNNRLLGGHRYWLRVSARRLLDTFAPLVSVQAQAVPLRRLLKRADGALSPLPAGSVKGPETPVPGLAGVHQPEASSGLRPAETASDLRTRAAERLRHKNRASLIWDYERLVLAFCPEVYKVRCFAWSEVAEYHDRAGPLDATRRPVPGTVLLAVVPQVQRNDPACATLAPRLDTLALQRIHQMLARHVGPDVTLEVRNAHYERVQARCTLRLEPAAQRGDVRRRVNATITEYLSPWFDEGFGPRFDWVLRCEEVETAVRKVSGVAEVAGLSLLHVTNASSARYTLGDTAGSQQREGGRALQRRRPWSLALPLGEHLIDIAGRLDDVEIKVTGINDLRIGQTFVVGEPEPPGLRVIS